MKRAISIAIIIVTIAAIFYVTKPSGNYVKEEASAQLRKYLDPSMPAGVFILMEQQISVEEGFFYRKALLDRGGSKIVMGYGVVGTYINNDISASLKTKTPEKQ